MTPIHRPIAAAVWMLGSILGFSALAVSGREIGAALDTFEMMLYRSLIGILVTMALTLAPASVVTPIDFLRLPLIALVGMTLYAEPLDLWVFAGGGVIFAANWINVRAEAKYLYVTA